MSNFYPAADINGKPASKFPNYLTSIIYFFLDDCTVFFLYLKANKNK